MLKSLTKNEYIALLLIEAAEIDFDFAPEEKDIILEYVSEAQFLRLLWIYNANRLLCHKVLKERITDFFPSLSEQKDLKSTLLQLFLADNSYNQFERTFMEMFREEFMKGKEISPSN